MADETVVATRGLFKAYGATVAVNGVDFTLNRGDILGLVGPNGAGKTTLMRMLATLLWPTRGEARVFGHDLRTGYLQIRQQMGYLPDFFNLYRDLTLAECLQFFAHAYKIPPNQVDGRVTEAVRAVGLTDPHHTMVRHLSRGMVQRLGVAALLVRDADLLILDEPASGLDPRARVQLRELLKTLGRQGKTILVSSHILSDLSDACTHIAIMDRGNVVVQGPVADVLQQSGETFRVRFSVLGDPELAADRLRSEGVSVFEVLRDGVVAAASGREEIAAVNARLVRQDIQVIGIEVEGGGLEDLFMRITGEAGGGVETH